MKWLMTLALASAFCTVYQTADYTIEVPKGYEVEETGCYLCVAPSSEKLDGEVYIVTLRFGEEVTKLVRQAFSHMNSPQVKKVIEGALPSGDEITFREWKAEGDQLRLSFMAKDQEGETEYGDCVLVARGDALYFFLACAENAEEQGLLEVVRTSFLSNFQE